MLEFLKSQQLDVMLSLSSICGIIAVFVLVTKTLPQKRRRALMLMELSAMLLLATDRCAYIYRGDPSELGFWMVRISNFLVYMLILCVIWSFNLYLADLYTHEGVLDFVPKRLKAADFIAAAGIVVLTVSQFTGFYYTFDEANRYQRAPGFIVSYLFPLLMLLLHLSVVIQYYSLLRKGLRLSLLLFTVAPLAASAVQVFAYGLSLTNIALSCVAVLLFIVSLMDMNKTVERANRIEIEYLKEEQDSMRRLFDQTAKAFVNAIDRKDDFTRGHSSRVAEYSRKIAEMSGKSPQECDEAYYAGLLHDVGKIGIPDSIFNKEGKLTAEERKIVEEHTLIGRDILSSITEFPYLGLGAQYHHERFDGAGYPERLKGGEIPDIARIIATADAYDTMTSKRRYREAMPQQKVREEFVKGTGTQFDPKYAKIMLDLIDADSAYSMRENADGNESVQTAVLTDGGELHCAAYKSVVSEGVRVSGNLVRIRFSSRPDEGFDAKTSIPAVILFDSLDGAVHSDANKIRNLNYLEYCEIWFDGHSVATAARNIRAQTLRGEQTQADGEAVEYTVEAVRCGDHMRIRIAGGGAGTEFIIALPDSARYSYLGITGEHCTLGGVTVEETEETAAEGDIPRIADEISYIDRIEGSIPNLQVNGYRSAATEGIPVADGMRLSFHTMSLPTANLVWHCPFIALYSSDDGRVNGENYHELALIRLDGETVTVDEAVKNRLFVNKDDDFRSWDVWKEQNRKGYDCVVSFRRRGDRITTATENCGIALRNITSLSDGAQNIYAALTGDQCALTDIQIL
ncbi:MAG: HD-GYP domain-containing protein [Oscillospiraceae bacterium]|nr:HD-GYP domain-containing protein [Oscillospiraceae bacterium]